MPCQQRGQGDTLGAVLARDPDSCEQIEVWLHLVVDGECGPEEQATVDRHLAHCEQCTRNLGVLERTRAGLRQAAHQVDVQAPDALLARLTQDRLETHLQARRPLLLLSGLLLFLLGAAAIAWFMPRDVGHADPVLHQLTGDHALDVPVDVASPDADRVSNYLESRLGEPLVIPSMHDIGLSLRGGRVISVEGQRAAQLAYLAARQQRVSIIIIPDHQRTLSHRLFHRAPTFEASVDDVRIGAVRVGSHLYAVIGDLSEQSMRRVTTRLAR